MLWFIAAFIIATGVYKFTPANVTTQTIANSNKDGLGHIGLFILLGVVLLWLLFTVFQEGTNSYAAASFGFVLTACTIALAKFHKFMIPCALITVISIIIGALNT